MRNKNFGFHSNDTAGISANIEDERIQPLNGLRHPEDDYSGWFLWRGEFVDDDSFFKPRHLRHVEDIIPSDLLALGPGYRFILDTKSGYRDVWYDKSLLIKNE